MLAWGWSICYTRVLVGADIFFNGGSMPLKSLFAASLILTVAVVTACDSDSKNDQNKGMGDSYCESSSDCAAGKGCVLALHTCVSLTERKTCLSDYDCTEEQICVRLTESSASQTEYANTYCSFRCASTDDCMKWGINTRCSTEQKGTDYNHFEDFCTKVPVTCRNGVLDEGEVCDIDTANGNKPIFASENVSCSDWRPGAYKEGGMPGCAKTCIAFTKGSGKTKCAFADELDNIEGMNTCYASLYIDDESKYAYATVNYSIYLSNAERNADDGNDEKIKAMLDKVHGAILCSPKETGAGIVVTQENIPAFTSKITNYNLKNYAATMYIERDLASLASSYTKEGACVVYIQSGIDASSRGVICNLAFSSNEASENLRECFSEELNSQNTDLKDDEDVDLSEIVYDFPIYQPLLPDNKCSLNMYPYVSFGSTKVDDSDPDLDDNLKPFMVWDEFSTLMNGGYPLNNKSALELLLKGLAPDSGGCLSSGICTEPKLTLSKKSNITNTKLTMDQTATESQVFGTLLVGPVNEPFDVNDLGATSYLSITADGLEQHSKYHLTVIGNTRSLVTEGEACGTFNHSSMGKLAISYIDANGETVLEKDVLLPEDESVLCCGVQSPKVAFCDEQPAELSDTCTDPQNCLNKNYEVKRTFALPDTVSGLKEIRIYMYDQSEKNFRFNTIRVDAVSSVIM